MPRLSVVRLSQILVKIKVSSILLLLPLDIPTDSSLATWNSEFTAAMAKLSLLGIDQDTASGFVDCTSLI